MLDTLPHAVGVERGRAGIPGRAGGGGPWDQRCASRTSLVLLTFGCTPSMPPVRASATEREEPAVLMVWTARAAVMLNHGARRPEAGPCELAHDPHTMVEG